MRGVGGARELVAVTGWFSSILQLLSIIDSTCLLLMHRTIRRFVKFFSKSIRPTRFSPWTSIHGFVFEYSSSCTSNFTRSLKDPHSSNSLLRLPTTVQVNFLRRTNLSFSVSKSELIDQIAEAYRRFKASPESTKEENQLSEMRQTSNFWCDRLGRARIIIGHYCGCPP